MKKRLAIFSFILLLVVAMTGCKKEMTEEEKAMLPFEGDYLVTAEYVKEHMNDENVLIVDCRGESAAKKGTPEGAIALTWQDISTCDKSYGKAGDEGFGKIPEAADFAERLGNYGMTKEKELIMVGETAGGWGDDARVLWQLVAAGYENVKMVDGGFTALKAADIPMQKGASDPVAGTVTIDALDMTHVMETDELAENYDDYVVLDVRTKAEYDGATKYGEAKGGHLPGAIFFPYTELFKGDDTLKSKVEIEKMMEEAGISKDDKIVTYCTGGIRSAYVQLVLEMCGYENTWNYDQSYCRWCVVHEVEK